MRSERGDIVTVGFVVVFLLLMAALGVIFYQNVINRTADQKQQTTEEQKETADQKITERIAYKNTIYALDRLAAWKVQKAQPSGRITLTSPDDVVEVRLTITSAVPLSDCKEDERKVRFIAVDPQPVSALAENPVYLVEVVYDQKGEDGFNYTIGLVPDGGDTTATVGDSHCTVKNVGTVAVAAETYPTIRAEIILRSLPDGTKHNAESIQQVTDMLVSDTYKQAKQAILSARKE